MSGFEIRPLTPTIGAEIHGIDLGKKLSQTSLEEIEQALLDHMVLVFRGQDITPEQHLDFGRNFGEVYCPAMSAFPPEHPEIMLLDTTTPKGAGADNWHCDATFMPEPPLGAILRPVQLPPSGGDTCFANMVAAYEALSPAMRSMLEGLEAVHDLSGQLRISVDRGISPEDFDSVIAKWPPVRHPVARTHPRTGRKSLFLNKTTGSRLVGVTDRENDLLVPFLLDHVRAPEFQCRVRWEPDCIAFWDNRCTQHCGVPDFSERRIMHRVTVAGDKPY
jgi:taurine dioxygenase